MLCEAKKTWKTRRSSENALSAKHAHSRIRSCLGPQEIRLDITHTYLFAKGFIQGLGDVIVSDKVVVGNDHDGRVGQI